MVIKGFRFIAVLLLSVPAIYHSAAQNGINTPYSQYGIGVLSEQSTGIAKAMGGIGAGFRVSNTLNMKNPASYSMVDTLTFIADLGFSLQNGNFKENSVRVNAQNASIDHMAMQFRILPKVGMTVAFTPFSNVGYSFSREETTIVDEDGEITATNTYTGQGGIRQFMAGLGWRPTEYLSVGVNASYLSGDLTRTVSNTYSSSVIQSRVKTKTAEMSGFKLDWGIQGTININKNPLVLGATYSPAFKPDCDAMVTDAHSVTDTTTIKGAFSFPDQFSAGFTYQWKNRYRIGADVAYQKWSDALFFGNKEGSDRVRVAAGFMILPREMNRGMFKRASYQVGANMSQPYFVLENGSKGPMEFGVSAGISLPITTAYYSMSYLHVSGEFVRMQPSGKGMITENYFRINLGVTFMERWFMKLMVD